MREYDEQEILARLAALDRRSRTAFAASCAERLVPLFERDARSVGAPELGPRLRELADAAWGAASGVDIDAGAFQADAEGIMPSDADGWVREAGYGQNAAAAVAYAIRTWLADSPQEAAWAARQVYEVGDYEALPADSGLDPNSPGVERRVLESAAVQRTLTAIARSLSLVEVAPLTWHELRGEAEADGEHWASALP